VQSTDRRQGEQTPPPVEAPWGDLHTLWFQVSGLHCNLSCTHCLVSSSPKNRTLAYLTLDDVHRALHDATLLGVKEIYFTGGEPFLHPDLLAMIEASLAVAPTTVLTNATLIDDSAADSLATLSAASAYSLELRISLDDVDPEVNDAIRGAGVLARVARAVKRLDARGLLPILTATEITADAEAVAAAGAPAGKAPGQRNGSMYDRFRRFLTEQGVKRPRVKIMPVFRIGRLAGIAQADAQLTASMLEEFDCSRLQCHASRVVAADGIYACPILAGQPIARMAGPGELTASFRPIPLSHPACYTCYETGMTCSNA
jgi:hypothetical protein